MLAVEPLRMQGQIQFMSRLLREHLFNGNLNVFEHISNQVL